MPATSRRGGETHASLAICVYFITWLSFALVSVYPGFVHEDPAEISMWGRLGFHWGYVKHPPLLPWIFGIVDHVVPITWVTISVLAAANLTLAVGLVGRIAAQVIGAERAPLAAALFCLSPYTTTQAIKLNHNSLLVSLWPLAVLMFLRMLRHPTWSNGMMVGFAAALAVYAKYSSALLLVGFVVAALVSRRRRAIFTSSATYVAVGTFIVLMAPHFAWMVSDRMATIAYAGQSLAPPNALPEKLLWANAGGLIPVLIGAGLMAALFGSKRRSTALDAQALQLIAIVIGFTYLTTVGLTMFLGLRGSHTWTMPVFALVPVLAASLLNAPTFVQIVRLRMIAGAASILVPLTGAAGLAFSFNKGALSAVDPQYEFVTAARTLWVAGVDRPVGILAGDHRYVMTGSLVLPEHPLAWPTFQSLWWITPDKIKKQGVLILCRSGEDPICEAEGHRRMVAEHGWHCTLEQRRTLWGRVGPLVKVEIFMIPPEGTSTKPSCEPQLLPEKR
jgi:hypothetical protein